MFLQIEERNQWLCEEWTEMWFKGNDSVQVTRKLTCMYVILFLKIICLLDFQVLFGCTLFLKGPPWRWSTSVVVHSSISFLNDSSLCLSSNYASAGSGERYLPRNSHFVMSIAKPDWLPLDAHDADGLPQPSCPPETCSLQVIENSWIPSPYLAGRLKLHVQISGRVDTVHNLFNLPLFHTM